MRDVHRADRNVKGVEVSNEDEVERDRIDLVVAFEGSRVNRWEVNIKREGSPSFHRMHWKDV